MSKITVVTPQKRLSRFVLPLFVVVLILSTFFLHIWQCFESFENVWAVWKAICESLVCKWVEKSKREWLSEFPHFILNLFCVCHIFFAFYEYPSPNSICNFVAFFLILIFMFPGLIWIWKTADILCVKHILFVSNQIFTGFYRKLFLLWFDGLLWNWQ